MADIHSDFDARSLNFLLFTMKMPERCPVPTLGNNYSGSTSQILCSFHDFSALDDDPSLYSKMWDAIY